MLDPSFGTAFRRLEKLKSNFLFSVPGEGHIFTLIRSDKVPAAGSASLLLARRPSFRIFHQCVSDGHDLTNSGESSSYFIFYVSLI